MKILFLEQFSEMGGGQRNLLDLLAICARGWQAVVAAPGAGPLFNAAREAGAESEDCAGTVCQWQKSNPRRNTVYL